MKRPRIALLAFVVTATALLGVLTGCATTYRVQVNALSDPELAARLRTYTLAPGDKDTRTTDLLYREMADHARAALLSAGLTETDPTSAALRIELTYGTGDPVTRTITSTQPIYSEIGGGIARTTREVKDANGKVSTVTETSVIPGRYERVGTDVTSTTVTTYRKHVQLSARLPGDQGLEVWNASALTDDFNNDIRSMAPYLFAALGPQIGQRTPKAIVVELQADNPAVQRVIKR